jgi:arginase
MYLILVPYMVGDERHPSAKGPELLAAAMDASIAVKRVDRGEPFRDSASASRAVNMRVAQAAREAVAADQLPVVLAGSCDVCMGVLGGFEHARCGVVWFDAHADFNTPESTASGFFAGMSLAVITGHCYGNLWAQIGDSTPVLEEATTLVGVRDLSPPAERERLERSAIRAVPPGSDALPALDELAARVHEVYVHVDLDALDPEVAPGIVDDPVPGGLSLEEMDAAVRGLTERFRIRAAAVTTYNPELDRDDKTLAAALRIVERLTPS